MAPGASPSVSRAADGLAREVEALRAASTRPIARVARDASMEATDARRRLEFASTTTRTAREIEALTAELAEREMFWRDASEAQERELRALASSAESRARRAEAEADALRMERDSLVRELEDALERERMQNAAIWAKREKKKRARLFAEASRLRRALAKWIEGAVFNIRARMVLERSRRRALKDAFASFHRAVELSRKGSEIERRANEQRVRRCLVHWAVGVEVSRAGERALARRVMIRWSRAMSNVEIPERPLASRTARERAVAVIERVRATATKRAAFSSWLLFVAGAKSARTIALELIAKERVAAREASLARLKATRRGT